LKHSGDGFVVDVCYKRIFNQLERKHQCMFLNLQTADHLSNVIQVR